MAESGFDIMIVDDDEAGARLLSGMLTIAGYIVRPASSGALALRSVRAKRPALILLDIRMPEMDGFEVARALKSVPETRDIPIIFISVSDEPREKVKGFEAGCVDYIVKPFEAREVLARVGTHLELHRAREELRRRSAKLEDLVEARTSELRREVERRVRIAEELERLVAEKGTLMRELQHRAKNSLNTVAALLSLERRNLRDDFSREIFGKMEARIRSMAVIYEQLAREGRIDSIRLDSYLDRLIAGLADSYLPPGGAIALRADLAPTELDLTRSVSVGLIVAELVVNAIKYAFKPESRGEIRIELGKESDRIALRVFDDGVGLSGGTAKDAMPGTSDGMGFQLVEMLVGQLDGSLSIRGDRGTDVSISFDADTARRGHVVQGETER